MTHRLTRTSDRLVLFRCETDQEPSHLAQLVSFECHETIVHTGVDRRVLVSFVVGMFSSGLTCKMCSVERRHVPFAVTLLQLTSEILHLTFELFTVSVESDEGELIRVCRRQRCGRRVTVGRGLIV